MGWVMEGHGEGGLRGAREKMSGRSLPSLTHSNFAVLNIVLCVALCCALLFCLIFLFCIVLFLSCCLDLS